jgi:hypothetical protein
MSLAVTSPQFNALRGSNLRQARRKSDSSTPLGTKRSLRVNLSVFTIRFPDSATIVAENRYPGT